MLTHPPTTVSRGRETVAARAGHSDITEPQLDAAAATFTLLSSPSRLQLVYLSTKDTFDVGTLASRVGISVATASHHLAKLRLAGIVTVTRSGRRHLYTVQDPHILALVDQIFAHISPDGTLAPDPAPRGT